MRKFYLLCLSLIVAFGMFGCEEENNDGDMIKGLVCEVENGEYTGKPKSSAVTLIALAIQLGAGEFGADVDPEQAKQIAEKVLGFYCEGKIDDIFGGLDAELKRRGYSKKQRQATLTLLQKLKK